MIFGLMILIGWTGNGEGIAIGLMPRLDLGTSFISGSFTSGRTDASAGFSTGLSAGVRAGGILSVKGSIWSAVLTCPYP